MIVGDGLMAKSIQRIDSDELCLFCSGVSNSMETSRKAFEREQSLLLSQPTQLKLIYFSTTSISNKAKENSQYIQHKIKMEELVRETFADYLILRLPNVVGLTKSQKTLIPFFEKAILENREVGILKNAVRPLLHTSDIVFIVESLILMDIDKPVNICFDEMPTVESIYKEMCLKLGKAENYVLKGSEEKYIIDNKWFMGFWQSHSLQLNSNWRDILDIYLSTSKS